MRLWNPKSWMILLLIFLGGIQAWAQLTAGSVIGSVKDPSGAYVPDARVTITNSRLCTGCESNHHQLRHGRLLQHRQFGARHFHVSCRPGRDL